MYRIGVLILGGSIAVFGSAAHASVCEPTPVSFSESFDDEDFKDEDATSADGWGDGALTLSAKGNAFETSSEQFGVRVFVAADGDFDGDGNNDMVAQLLSPNCHLHFLRNRGRDTSVSPPVFRGFDTGSDSGSPGFDAYRIDTPPTCSGSGPALVSGDFDGDGDKDFIYFTIRDQDRAGRVSHAYYYQNLGPSGGLPRFAPRVDRLAEFLSGTYEPAWHWTSNPQTVVDWDGDGLDDILLGSSYGSSSRVMLYRSNGAGFEPGYALLTDTGLTPPFADTNQRASGGCGRTSRGINGLSAADFDGDGDFDLVIGSLSQADLMYWRNDGSNVFTRLPNITFPEAGVTFSLGADFDGDGDADLMVGRDGWNCGGRGGNVYFFNNDGEGNFTRRQGSVVNGGVDLDYGLAFNIDGDSDDAADLIAADGNNSGTYNQMISAKLNIFNLEGVARSTVIDSLSNDTNAIVQVEVSINDEIPDGTSYDFFVSSNGGQDWEEVPESLRYGQEPYTFTHFGSDFLWRVDLNAEQDTLSSDELEFAPAAKKTPRIFNVDFTYYYVDRRLYSRSGLAFAPGLPLNNGETADVLYGSAFFYPGFEGYLYAYNITDFEGEAGSQALTSVNDDATVSVLWEGGESLRSTGGNSRTIYTARDADGDGAVDDRVLFIGANQGVLALEMSMSSADADELITYVRDGMEHRDGWKLYDAGHSTPTFVGAPSEDSDYAMFSDQNYADFASEEASRDGRVYVGSNAGMIHAFDAATGEEAWAFIPNNLLARLKQQREVASDGTVTYNHQFLVDGQITIRDVFDSNSNEWRTMLLAGQALGQGRGDNNYYFAIDVTDPDDPLPMWEFSDPWTNATQTCSGENPVTVCEEPICTETCSDSCSDPNHIFDEVSPGNIFIEAESYNGSSTIDGVHSWVDEGGSCPTGRNGSGFSGSCLNALPNDSKKTCNNVSNCGAQLVYNFQTQTAGTYRVHVRGLGESSQDNSIRLRINESKENNISFSKRGFWDWSTDKTLHELSAGDHTVTVYMRENGTRIDRLLVSLTSSPADSTYGAAESCMRQCQVGDCSPNCSEVTLTDSDEWPECGVGAGMRCCLGDEENVCHPAGESCPGPEAALGETWSRPAIAAAQVDGTRRFLAFFGSGYNNLENAPDRVGRSVYAIDAVTGEQLKRWDFDDLATESSNPSTIDNTVPGTPELVDLDDDGDVDRLYIGDLEGRLWKVEMDNDGLVVDGSVSDASWPSCVVFDAGDPEGDGNRTWAPIITKPAVAFPRVNDDKPHVYFGTGGDDRVPQDLRYRFYAIYDDLNCTDGPRTQPLVAYDDLSIDDLEWVVGDGVATDFSTELDPEDTEGDVNDRYWSDPVVLDNTMVFFASLPGSIESVNPCDNLGEGGSKFFGYAVRSFFDETAGVQRLAGEPVFDLGFLQAGSKIRQAVVLRKDGTTVGVTRKGAVPKSAAATDVFVQEFATEDAEQPDVLSITAPEQGRPGTEMRILRWREISLR